MTRYGHICGCYYIVGNLHTGSNQIQIPLVRKYLPQVDLSVHSTIVSSTSRTTLTQNFVNPSSDKPIPELRYTFPLYDGVSVVGFTCTINKDRVIRGVVKERNEARKTYDQAVARGETAGLLEQLPSSSDVFTTTVGNVPSGAEIKVEIVYLGELKQDAEIDGIRFTIPTSIAPRYGDYPGELVKGTNVSAKGGIKIIVDAEMPKGSNIKSVQSPSHPISVTIGNTSAGAVSGADMSLQKASATVSLATTELDKDFVLQVVATGTGDPVAVLETHPTLPNHRAIMATLVPKFNLPSSRPEIVFVCDRSGSMGVGQRIPNLKAALQIFLKSLPLGVKFNICSFGSRHNLLFSDGSVSYDESSVQKATEYIESFDANYGGTQMYQPLEHVIEARHKDMDLEIFLLTDGEVWNHPQLFNLVNKSVDETKGAIRLFTLGIGDDVSHALIEGLARAGNGFSQTVMDNEKMNSKVLRMLKAALTPHINDYSLEIKYEAESKNEDDDMDFEVIEKVMDALTVNTPDSKAKGEADGAQDAPKTAISLFDPKADLDVEMKDTSKDTTAGGKYSGVPAISEPKLLQAPFIIPALYPFNRTSVYVLLSPETVQRTPKSVVLRAMSHYGPLELELPITVLTEKAETIHQLAARKAIRELEDGRGWIFHAKDDSGNSLKAKLPGRFSDMVEREAVRLGVKFQVGGRWCSFVAVEGGDTTQPSEMSLEQEEQEEQEFSQDAVSKRLSRGGGLPPTYSIGGPSAPAMASRMCARVTRSPLMSLNSTSLAQPPPPAPIMPLPGKAARKTDTRAGTRSDTGADTSSRKKTAAAVSVLQKMADGVSAGSAQTRDIIEAIAALQTFDGYWKWTDGLFGLLSIDADVVKLQIQVSSNEKIAALGLDLKARSDELATAIVLALLEIRLQDRRDEWEMLADKAYDWLEANALHEAARGYVDIVRDLVADLDRVVA